MPFISNEDKEKLLRQHRRLCEEIHSRSNSIWVVNSILITGSLLVAFQIKSEAFPTPVAALVLLMASFILTATTNKLNRIWYETLEQIENYLDMKMRINVFASQVEGRWWYTLRVNAVYFLYASLTSIYFHLIFQRRLLSLTIFLLGISILIIREVRADLKREMRKSQQKRLS